MTAQPRTLDLRSLRADVPGRRTSIWAGVVLFIVIEATVIASLITSYYYFRVMAEEGWPPPGVSPPDLLGPAVSLLGLVWTLAPFWWARRAYRRERRRAFAMGLLLACLLLVGYIALAFFELVTLPYRWTEHVYASLVWTLSGYQLLHAFVLLFLALGVAFLGAKAGPRSDTLPREGAVSVLSLYWHFVVLVSFPTYFTIYIFPHLS